MRWFNGLFSRKSRYDELSASIAVHLLEKVDDFMDAGMSREEAERKARLEFGNPSVHEEISREVWQWPRLESFVADIRLALRQLLKAPAFTVTAVAALALGIGASSAVFSVVNTVILRPLGYPEPDRLVLFHETGRIGTFPVTSIQEFHLWQQQANLFQEVAASSAGPVAINLTGDHAKLVHGIDVTSSWFHLYGAPILLGRTFSREEENPNSGKTVVLSYRLWKNTFAGNPAILGESIPLGESSYTVIGVLSQGFESDPATDLWLPLQVNPNSPDPTPYYRTVGRLKPGISLDQANTQLKATANEFRRRFPSAFGPDRSFLIRPLRDSIIGNAGYQLFILLGAVSFVLVIACANVAHLQLIRASVRQREFAIRTSLGASRMRVLRQLLTESALLSLFAGVLGVGLSQLGIHLLLKVSSGNIPRIGVGGLAVGLDWRVLTFALSLSLLTGILFGLAPARGASHLDLNNALKERGPAASFGKGQLRARSLLVVCEAALAVVLSVGAALLIRTLIALQSVAPGFSANNVLTLEMALTGPKFQTTAAVAQLVHDARERMNALPGVQTSAWMVSLPLAGAHRLPVDIVGRSASAEPNSGAVQLENVSPGLLQVLQIPLLRGRDLRETDTSGAPPVALINQAMAKLFWPKENPVGQQILLGKGMPPLFADQPRQVVGIMGDILADGLQSTVQPMAIIPQAQMPDGITALTDRLESIHWLVRTNVDPRRIAPAIAEQLRQASGGLPTAEILTMRELKSSATARQNFNMQLLTFFAGSALILAAIGLYGLMAYTVQQRSQEIGVRMALGADRGDIRGMVVWHGMRLALLGIAIGIGAALPISRLLGGLLFGVKSWDPTVFAVIPTLLLCVALVAVWIPAARGARVDPMQSLRTE
jgi:putative ABC transport system permease protein